MDSPLKFCLIITVMFMSCVIISSMKGECGAWWSQGVIQKKVEIVYLEGAQINTAGKKSRGRGRLDTVKRTIFIIIRVLFHGH